jgi:hypothetical protein
MNFQNALKLMVEGKKLYIKSMQTKHLIGLDNLGCLFCFSCEKPKRMNLDMINSKDWKEEK